MQPQYIKRWADRKLLTSTAPVKPDLKQARAELKKATGVSISKPVKLIVPAGSANELADAQLIASELSAIGMNVQVQTPSVAEFNNDLGLGSYDMAIQYTTGTGDSPFWMYYLDFSDLLYKPVGQYSYTNWARYQNGTLNSLLASYKHAAKIANQVAVMKKAEAIIARDVPVVPLYNSDWWEEYNTSEFTGFPSKQDPYDLGSPFVGNLNANLNAALRIHLK
jgi:peptide/nickel transport system substrate-binding protein